MNVKTNTENTTSTRGRAQGGFTLVELLVVVVVIGILIAIAIPLYLRYQQGAYDASAQSDLRTVRLEERNYNVNNPDSFGTTSQLNANNQNIHMSANTIGGVAWANSDGFCVFTINTKGKSDPNGVGSHIGYPYVAYFYDSTTAQTSTTGCSTRPTDFSALDGYFDSDGFHHI